MHRETRAWNVPLGIGLFGAAVLVGGAILAYPEVHRPESPVDVSDPIATRPFPSFPGEIPALQQPQQPNTAPVAAPTPLPAPSGFGGGPNEPAGSAEVPAASASAPSEGTTPAATSAAPPAPGAAAATEAAADASSAALATADAESTAVSDAATTAVADAGRADAGAGYSVADTGWTSFSDAFSAPTYNSDAAEPLPYVYPAYGAPPPAAGVTGQMPVTTGAAGDAAPLWTTGGGATGGNTTSSGGSSGTGGTGGNTGVVNPQPSITAPLLVPMAAGTQPENLWTTISPFIRGGDFVVAHTAGDPATFLGFSDRIRTDSPLATYVVAFYTPATLQASLNKLPATLSVVGLSSVGSMNEATLTAASNAVHAAGRRMFLSVNVPSSLPLATIGARVDVIELVVGGATAAEVAANAKGAAAAIGAKAHLFVRLPPVNSTAAAVSASGTITAAMPGAGVSIPWTPNIGTTVSAYRGTTQ